MMACPDLSNLEPEWALVFYGRKKPIGLTFYANRKGLLMQITELDLTVGSPAVHVTVADQNQNPLPPTSVTWALDASLAGVEFVQDDTGFSFSAPSGTAAETGNAVATYTVNGLTGTLPVVKVSEVTALTFLSP